MTPQQALGRAALVLAGGLLQTLLVVGLWPLRTRGQERRAVAEAFAALARYAADGATRGALPEADPFADAATALSDANPLGQDHVLARFRALLHVAERARMEIAALGRARAQLGPRRSRRRGRPSSTSCWGRPRGCSPASPRPWPAPGLPWQGSGVATRGLTDPLRGGTALEEQLPGHVAAVSRGLRGQLRAAARIAAGLEADEDPLTDDGPPPAGAPARSCPCGARC